MKLQSLRHLSDMRDDFEPSAELAATLENTELALAEKMVEAITALQREAPAHMKEYATQLATLAEEHRHACSDLLLIDVRLTVEKAFDDGRDAM